MSSKVVVSPQDVGLSSAAKGKWSVYYFDAPNRGEQVRLLLVLAGVPFNDVRFKDMAPFQHAVRLGGRGSHWRRARRVPHWT